MLTRLPKLLGDTYRKELGDIIALPSTMQSIIYERYFAYTKGICVNYSLSIHQEKQLDSKWSS
jgi:hypothetical protein